MNDDTNQRAVGPLQAVALGPSEAVALSVECFGRRARSHAARSASPAAVALASAVVIDLPRHGAVTATDRAGDHPQLSPRARPPHAHPPSHRTPPRDGPHPARRPHIASHLLISATQRLRCRTHDLPVPHSSQTCSCSPTVSPNPFIPIATFVYQAANQATWMTMVHRRVETAASIGPASSSGFRARWAEDPVAARNCHAYIRLSCKQAHGYGLLEPGGAGAPVAQPRGGTFACGSSVRTGRRVN